MKGLESLRIKVKIRILIISYLFCPDACSKL